MKKILNRFLLITLTLALTLTIVGAKGTYAATYEDLPAGKNYIENVNVDAMGDYFFLTDDIKIKADTNYTLTLPFNNPAVSFDSLGREGAITIVGNASQILLTSINGSNYSSLTTYNSTDGTVSLTFNSGSNVYLTTMLWEFSGDMGFTNSTYYQLEEGTVSTSYEAFVDLNADVLPPVLSGGTGVWLTNVDSPDSVLRNCSGPGLWLH